MLNDYHGFSHVKLASESGSPPPRYVATCGYTQAGRDMTTVPVPSPANFFATSRPGATSSSTHVRMALSQST